MIKNDLQLGVTKTRLRELQAHLQRLRRTYSDPGDFDFYSEATRDMLREMKREIREYHLVKTSSIERILRLWAKRGALKPSKKGQLSIGELIAMLRMAKGMTQEELAQRLGTRQAHVARFERRGYSGFSVATLNAIFTVLGVRVGLAPVRSRKAA